MLRWNIQRGVVVIPKTVHRMYGYLQNPVITSLK